MIDRFSHLWLLVALAAGAAACAERTRSAEPACKIDLDCDDGAGCMGGVCVPRSIAPSVWAVELTPRSGTAMAFTQLPAIALEQGGALPVEESQQIDATFDASSFQRVVPSPDTALVLHVFVIGPSVIAGRPPLQIEATASADFSAAKPTLDLWLPHSLIDDLVTVQTVASAPTDQNIPPFAFPTKPLAGITVALPTEGDLVYVEGTLVSATGEPLGGYEARVWPAPYSELDSPSNSGTPLSTVGTTSAADGSFRLALSASYLAGGRVSWLVVELVRPASASEAAPRFVTTAFSADVTTWKTMALRMAPYINPITYRLKVVGDDGAGGTVPLANSTARFRTTLVGGTAAGGSTAFVADGQSGVDGMLELRLIPGGALQPQSYHVRVTPPSDSPYASQCLTGYAVASSGSDSPVYGPELKLVRKALLSGVVLGADGKPARDVSVRATLVQAADLSCGSLSSVAPSTITDRDGGYVLHVEPGTYALDVDPPSGSPLPRLTEDGVAVMADTLHDVRLLPAGMLDAVVVNPRLVDAGGAAAPVAGTGVRVYRMVCSDGNLPPCIETQPRAILAGQGQSDSSGKVRLVLPAR